jgi:hypothetical protein
MLRAADLTGFDPAIAAPIALVQMSPRSSVLHVPDEPCAGVDDPVIALGIDDQSGGIGEDL